MIIHLIIKFSKAIGDLHFRHNIACFCSVLPTKIFPNNDHSTVLHLWAMEGVYSLNESAFWTNWLNKWFSDSLINSVKCFVWKALPDEVLLLTQTYKMEKRVKTEHNLATQLVYEHFIYIYIIYIYIIFASFPFCIYLYFDFHYFKYI